MDLHSIPERTSASRRLMEMNCTWGKRLVLNSSYVSAETIIFPESSMSPGSAITILCSTCERTDAMRLMSSGSRTSPIAIASTTPDSKQKIRDSLMSFFRDEPSALVY